MHVAMWRAVLPALPERAKLWVYSTDPVDFAKVEVVAMTRKDTEDHPAGTFVLCSAEDFELIREQYDAKKVYQDADPSEQLGHETLNDRGY